MRTNQAWLWKRLHGATDREAIDLASTASTAPTDAAAAAVLDAHRAAHRWAPAHPLPGR